ncbi:MAG: hypothetical protein ACPL7E_00610, partial [bacterium]
MKNKKLLYGLLASLLLLLLFSSFLAGFVLRGAFKTTPIFLAQEPSSDFGVSLQPIETLWKVLRLIKDQYVEKISDDKQLIYGAIRGMLG